MLAVFSLFAPIAAAAPTETGTTPTVQETGKTGKFRPGQEESRPLDTGTNYRELALKIAAEYGVSGSEMVRVIDCENRDWNPKVQSGLKYKPGNRWVFPAGEREHSYGLVMIHLPDHPGITYEQATNAEWSLRWMAHEFKKGRQGQWTCY